MSTETLGMTLAIVIGIHNIPEGLAMATTASIIPPDRPIKKSRYLLIFLLNSADIITPRPVPNEDRLSYIYKYIAT